MTKGYNIAITWSINFEQDKELEYDEKYCNLYHIRNAGHAVKKRRKMQILIYLLTKPQKNNFSMLMR